MSDWIQEAAEAASFEVRKEYAPLLATYGAVLSEASAKKVTEIIEAVIRAHAPKSHILRVEFKSAYGNLTNVATIDLDKFPEFLRQLTQTHYTNTSPSRMKQDRIPVAIRKAMHKCMTFTEYAENRGSDGKA